MYIYKLYYSCQVQKLSRHVVISMKQDLTNSEQQQSRPVIKYRYKVH